MTDIPQYPRLVTRTPEELRAFVARPDLVHFIGMPIRPSVAECMRRLEFTHYPPATDRNELFHINLIEWAKVTWALISIPGAEKGLMEQEARATGLALLWGPPRVSVNGTVQMFPFPSVRLFSLVGNPYAAPFDGVKQ